MSSLCDQPATKIRKVKTVISIREAPATTAPDQVAEALHKDPVSPKQPQPELTDIFSEVESTSTTTSAIVRNVEAFPGSTETCRSCVTKTKKCDTLQRTNRRLKRKIAELKQTIRDRKNVSIYILKLKCFFYIQLKKLLTFYPLVEIM